MYVRPVSPQSIGGVLDDAIKLYRESFRACWPVAAAAAVIMGAMGVYLTLHVLGGVVLNPRAPMQILNEYRQPNVLLVYLADVTVRLAGYGAMMIYQDALAEADGTPSMREALGVMLGRLVPGLVATLAWWVVITVGTILLVVPGIYFAGALCLWPVCLFVGRAGPLKSLEQSMELISGHWWRVGTIIFLALVLMLVLSSIAGVVVGALIGIFWRDLTTLQLSLQAVGVTVSIFTLPMMPAVLVATYRDLKLRREGSDLAARLGALPSG